MKNDQWFEPGDKVVRVCWGDSLGIDPSRINPTVEAPEGDVYCVTHFRNNGSWNEIWLAGFGEPPTEDGFFAACFRRVEELRLCVEAAERMKKPSEKEATV